MERKSSARKVFQNNCLLATNQTTWNSAHMNCIRKAPDSKPGRTLPSALSENICAFSRSFLTTFNIPHNLNIYFDVMQPLQLNRLLSLPSAPRKTILHHEVTKKANEAL
jgi:hypothetical protein